MTATAEPAVAPALSPFEGKAVRKVGIEMPSAAGGLREALQFEPIELHHGQEGYMLVHWKVGKVRFDPIDKSDIDTSDLQRNHVLVIKGVTLVEDEAWAQKQVADQARRIQVAKEKAKGLDPLAADGVDASDWGGESGPFDPPVDPEGAKVIEGAFGAGAAAPTDPSGPVESPTHEPEGDNSPGDPPPDVEGAPADDWEDQAAPPPAEKVKSRRRD